MGMHSSIFAIACNTMSFICTDHRPFIFQQVIEVVMAVTMPVHFAAEKVIAEGFVIHSGVLETHLLQSMIAACLVKIVNDFNFAHTTEDVRL